MLSLGAEMVRKEQNLWVTTQNTNDENWSEPVNLGPIINIYTQIPTQRSDRS
jgi:hypothetical protein